MKIKLSFVKHGLLAVGAVSAACMVLFMAIGNMWHQVEFMMLISVICLNGTGITFYLDAIYETRNPDQP